MQDHLRKHLVQGLFLLAIVLAVRASDLVIGPIALLATVVVSLGLLEAGLRVIHRRDVATS